MALENAPQSSRQVHHPIQLAAISADHPYRLTTRALLLQNQGVDCTGMQGLATALAFLSNSLFQLS
jgi:hypothetical protein